MILPYRIFCPEKDKQEIQHAFENSQSFKSEVGILVCQFAMFAAVNTVTKKIPFFK